MPSCQIFHSVIDLLLEAGKDLKILTQDNSPLIFNQPLKSKIRSSRSRYKTYLYLILDLISTTDGTYLWHGRWPVEELVCLDGECLHTKRMRSYLRCFSITISSFTDSLDLFTNRLWVAFTSSYMLNTHPFSILNIVGN